MNQVMTPPASSPNPADRNVPAAVRPWLGVRFVCGGVYTRVYRNPTDAAYNARCPRCGECVRFTVAPGGQEARLYEVDCGVRRV